MEGDYLTTRPLRLLASLFRFYSRVDIALFIYMDRQILEQLSYCSC
jgi:hypothetical protein